MNPRKDIYNYKVRLEGVKRRLEKATISRRNKELISKFDRACFIEGLSKPRRIKLMGSLIILAEEYLRKDFDNATKEELKDIVMRIDSREDYSPWTQHSYRVIIKKFYKWLEYGDEYKQKLEYPEIVSWLRSGLKKKDQPKVKASDLLTEEEVKRLIETAEHPRDRAFISMLYELGARIGEIGGLLIKELTRDKYGYIVDLEGKTGHRTPRIVISGQYITAWLNIHPNWDKPEAPLWVMLGNRNKGKKMAYAAFRAIVKRLVAKAGIKKRVYHHLFRHTRVTHLLIDRQINEAQAKVYFGWVPESKMLSEYSHLMSSDVNDAILAMHGIKTGEEKQSPLKAKQCHRCQKINAGTARYCQQCSSPLDVRTALELDERRNKADDVLAAILKKRPELRRTIVRAILEMGLKDDLLGSE